MTIFIPAIEPKISLIAIHGKAHSGKDTVCGFLGKYIEDAYQEAFADPLKEAAAELFGLNSAVFYDSELKEQLAYPWPVTHRQIAQFFGTEMVRETMYKLLPQFGAAFWVARMAYLINGKLTGNWEREYFDGETVIITDLRFQEEYDWVVENNGVIIHLTRPGADGNIGIPGHASERGINYSSKGVHYEVENSGTLEELDEKVKDIAQSITQRNLFKSL